MKKVVRLTESELVRIVKRMISENELTFYKRRGRLINDFLDEVISEKNAEYDAIDYEDYKSEVLWSVLANIEEINGEVRDVEEYFEFMNVFDEQIKKGYDNYKKRRK